MKRRRVERGIGEDGKEELATNAREKRWKRKWCAERSGKKKREVRVTALRDDGGRWGEAGSVSV